MRKSWTGLAAVGAVIVIVIAVWAAEKEEKEEKVSIDRVPAAVKATIQSEGGKVEDVARERKGDKQDKEIAEARKALAQAKVTLAEAVETAMREGKGARPVKAELEIEDGKAMFDIELLEGDKGPEMEIDAISGKVLKIESVEEQEKEDAKEGNKDSKEEQEEAKEKAEAAKALPTATVTMAQAIETATKEVKESKAFSAQLEMEKGRPQYEVEVIAGEKCMEVVIDGITRKIVEIEPKGEASGKEGGFRDSFTVAKADLMPKGKSPYFSLEPGHKATYKEGDTTLTITVLDETKVVDGVTTRIVEEREEKNGKPKEISRNYFAIDKNTGDVYYFGEDVDEYVNGKASHGGSWLAGEKGAKFGLMMPAKAKVGDKFYQELAPRVAMDRAEIVSIDEELKTPAGTFKCLHVKETSGIERGASHKWYAAGVGLVKDDGFVLAGPEKPKE